MTRATAANLLRELGQGDETDYGVALALAARVLDPPAKTKAGKLSPHVAYLLKQRFPVGVTRTPALELWPDLNGRRPDVPKDFPPQAAAQFAYGSRDRVAKDPAVLYAAQVTA